MPNQVLFVQGAGEGVHDEWDRALVESLRRGLGPDYAVRYPRMPDEGNPRYPAWRAALREALEPLGAGAVLVGHSVGATVLLHTLAEAPPRFAPAAVVLIAAPFIGDGGWPGDEIPADTDFAARLPAAMPVLLYHGTADPVVPFAHAALYARALPGAVVRALAGRDHQLGNDLAEVAAGIRALSGFA